MTGELWPQPDSAGPAQPPSRHLLLGSCSPMLPSRGDMGVLQELMPGAGGPGVLHSQAHHGGMDQGRGCPDTLPWRHWKRSSHPSPCFQQPYGHELFPGFLLTGQPSTPGKPGSPRRENHVLGASSTEPPLKFTAAAMWVKCSILRMRTQAQAGRGNHSFRAIDAHTWK